MRFGFLNIPFRGHVTSTVGLVEELVAQDHEVVYWLPDELHSLMEGVASKCYPYVSSLQDIEALIKDDTIVRELLSDALSFLSCIIEQARSEKLECLIADSGCSWATVVAKSLSCPLIMTHSISPPSFDDIYLVPPSNSIESFTAGKSHLWQLDTLCRQLFQLAGMDYDGEGLQMFPCNLILTFVPSWFDPNCGTASKFKCVGPILPKASRTTHSEKYFGHSDRLKLLYSMGTIFNKSVPLLQTFIDFVSDKQEYELLIASGRTFDIFKSSNLPKNVMLYEHVYQQAALQEADMFITHGGINSIFESMYNAVPMIIIPQIYEQEDNAMKVQELGIGLCIKPNEVTPLSVERAFSMIHSQDSFVRNAEIASGRLKESDSLQQSVQLILDYVANTSGVQ